MNHPLVEAAAMGALPRRDRIDLWHGSLEHAQWVELEHCLSDEERRRAERFVFERDARRFVVSHAVLRTLLGRAAGISPYEVAFRAEHGLKPVLV